jgi:hypothetical protein
VNVWVYFKKVRVRKSEKRRKKVNRLGNLHILHCE